MFKPTYFAILAVICGFLGLGLVTTARADAGPNTVLVDAGPASAPVAANGCPAGKHLVVAPDGERTCVELPPAADKLPNPATAPVQAWDDAKAAKKTAWPLLVWLSLVMIGKALAYGRDKLKGLPVVGWIGRRLAQGKAAMAVAAIGAVGAAGYDVLVSGGSWVAALVVSGAALGGVLHSTTKNAGEQA